MTSFCRFTVGTPGASAVHLRYIARRGAVREGLAGCLLVNIEGIPPEGSYAELKERLEAYAWAREESEAALVRSGTGATRSHYRAVLSFEGEMPTPAIHAMVREWLGEVLPTARAMLFVHRNTEYAHIHAWIDARGTDGKKLDLSPRRYRSLGARWERIYAREMALRERLGALSGNPHDGGEREEGRAGGGRQGARGGTGPHEKESRRATPGEQALRACAQSADRTVRAAQELRRELERVARGREGGRGHDDGRGGEERERR